MQRQITSTNIFKGDRSVHPRKVEKYRNMLSDNAGNLSAKAMLNAGYGTSAFMDATPITADSIPALFQNLITFAPGTIRAFTEYRAAEELLGIVNLGTWTDESLAWKLSEMKGQVTQYEDLVDIPRSSYNLEYAWRDIVRLVGGIELTALQTARTARIQGGFNDADEKRASLARAFAIAKNDLSFLGFSGKRCFGMLNEPNLAPYQLVAPSGTGGSTLWSSKNFDQKHYDVSVMIMDLVNKSGLTFKPMAGDKFTFAVPYNIQRELVTSLNALGNRSLLSVLEETYKGMRVIAVPQLAGANAGKDVVYVYAESTVASDDSTDDGLVWSNTIQAEMFQLGAVPIEWNGSRESFMFAGGGVFLKRPSLVSRWSDL